MRHYEPSRFVFIVSGGRSGSTLLQGMLNALPGTLVRGENGFYVLHLFRAQRAARQVKDRYSEHSGQVTSAFYGAREMKMRDFVASSRRLVLRQLLRGADPRAVRVVGFKEIRWETIDPEEIDGFFRFFDQVFPDALYVLNERNPEVVVGSGHWQDTDRDTALRALARVKEIQQYLRESRPDRTYDTSFEIITGDDRAAADAQLKGLAEFVNGSCDEALLDDLRKVLEVGHGPFPFGGARRDRRGKRDLRKPGPV